jgi:transmembrane sensor
MTAERQKALRDAAVSWHLRTADGSVEDFEAFVAWLEADPAHAAAYDAVETALDEAALVIVEATPPEVAPLYVAANDDAPPAARRWWAGGGAAAAAALVLGVTFSPSLMQQSEAYHVATTAGRTQRITLPSGDRIALNGDSRITLDRKNSRYAQLDRGEALFTIIHDPSAPFEVRVGDERIQDVGTVFNVARGSGGVRVAVAEGSVLYNPDREAVTLVAGQSLVDPGSGGTIQRSDADPATVGGWREGRLSYTAAPLSVVVADLARAIGEPVTLDPTLIAQRFSGTIRVDPDRVRMFDDLSELLKVRARHGASGWTLAAGDRAKR